MTETRHFIPAAPGFWTLDLIGNGDPDSTFGVWRHPIVAWEMRLIDDDKLERGYFAVPVTTEWDTVSYHAETAPILAPYGRVRIAGESVHDSEEGWLEAAKKAKKRERAKEQASMGEAKTAALAAIARRESSHG